MAIKCGFFNSLNHDRVYDAIDMSSIFDGVITDGVFDNYGDIFAVRAGTGMQVIVGSGRAWFNHTWTVSDADISLEVEAADVSLTRIDAVVLEVNHTTGVRDNSIKILKGRPSANPAKPTLSNADDIYQHALAYITLPPGSTAVTNSMLDLRIGKSDCPFVTSILESVSIDALFAKWENDFTTWFADVQSQLSGDVAANLLNQINNKVNLSDKATDEEAMAGVADDKWMTPAKTMRVADQLANPIGQVKSALYSLEIEDPSFLELDGRDVLGSKYPKLLDKIGYAYGGVLPSEPTKDVVVGEISSVLFKTPGKYPLSHPGCAVFPLHIGNGVYVMKYVGYLGGASSQTASSGYLLPISFLLRYDSKDDSVVLSSFNYDNPIKDSGSSVAWSKLSFGSDDDYGQDRYEFIFPRMLFSVCEDLCFYIDEDRKIWAITDAEIFDTGSTMVPARSPAPPTGQYSDGQTGYFFWFDLNSSGGRNKPFVLTILAYDQNTKTFTTRMVTTQVINTTNTSYPRTVIPLDRYVYVEHEGGMGIIDIPSASIVEINPYPDITAENIYRMLGEPNYTRYRITDPQNRTIYKYYGIDPGKGIKITEDNRIVQFASNVAVSTSFVRGRVTALDHSFNGLYYRQTPSYYSNFCTMSDGLAKDIDFGNSTSSKIPVQCADTYGVYGMMDARYSMFGLMFHKLPPEYVMQSYVEYESAVHNNQNTSGTSDDTLTFKNVKLHLRMKRITSETFRLPNNTDLKTIRNFVKGDSQV